MHPVLQKLTSLVQDPAPDFVFEVSAEGIAFARPAAGVPPAFHPLPPGVLTVSPLSDNVQDFQALTDGIRAMTATGARRRGTAVVILPDYAARVAVLGFDRFPATPKEQMSLVRFRMKKSVPFDAETAALSYFPQSSGKNRTEVVVVAAALEIVARYEAAFRSAGLQPGLVVTSAVAMAELTPASGVVVLARLSGRCLTVLVTSGSVLKLVRTVELAETDPDEIQAVLFPTLAYVEDEIGAQADRILFCGMTEGGRLPEWVSELQIPAEPLRSRLGLPNGSNAGLLGYLESVGAGVRAA